MKTEILIIGGGIAGLTQALLLAQKGLSVTMLEPYPFPTQKKTANNGRTAALMGASIKILNALDLEDAFINHGSPLKTMRIIDDSNPNIDPVQIDFPAADIGLNEFGYNIPNQTLHALLAEKAQKDQNIEIIHGAKLSHFKQHQASITAILDNGHEITASLLIGADGKNSQTRQLANIGVKERDYDQSAITCLISHTRPHNHISTEHHRPGGPFTTVPMPDENGCHISSVVWVEKTGDSERYIKLDKQAFEKALQTRTRGELGEIKLASNPESWPLKAVIAQALTAPRIALIAEAAHAMSPIGAQGLNLSLRDVATLTEILIDAARLGEDLGSDLVLKRYAKRRHFDIQTRFNGVDGYNRIVSNNIGFLRGVRRAGLKTLKNIPAFKNIAMQHGLNPMGDDDFLLSKNQF